MNCGGKKEKREPNWIFISIEQPKEEGGMDFFFFFGEEGHVLSSNNLDGKCA